MNPDQPSREQIEARITALLLGELPAAEAELLRWTIAQDADLQKLHDELQSTIVLVRETVKPASTATSDKNETLKLSQEKRKNLLAQFKTPRPKPLFWLKPISMPSMSTLMVSAFVILFVIGIAALSIPNFVKARSSSQANSVINNMRQIDAAKQQWALENKKSAGDAPTSDDLKPYLAQGILKPVMGETYVLGKVSEPVAVDMDARLEKKQLVGFTAKGVPGGEPGRVRLQMEGDSSVTEPAAAATQVTTLAPEPVLAPPPVQIVLPSAEPPLPAVSVNGSLAGSPQGGVYSQSIVGYVNQPLDATRSLGVADANGLHGGASVNSSAGLSSFGGAGGVEGGGGGGRADTARRAILVSKSEPERPGAAPPAASATLGYTLRAEGDSGVNRPPAENPPAQLGRGFSLLGPVAQGGSKEVAVGEISAAGSLPAAPAVAYNFNAAPAQVVPQEKLPAITANGITDFQAGKPQELFKVITSDKLSTSGIRDRDGADLSARPVVDARSAADKDSFGLRSPENNVAVASAPGAVVLSVSEKIVPADQLDVKKTFSGYSYSGATPISNGALVADLPKGEAGVAVQSATADLKTRQTQFSEESKQIEVAQQNVEALRQNLRITDQANASFPTPTLDNQDLQVVNQQMIEGRRLYQEQSAQLQELKSIQTKNPEKLREVLPQMVSDTALNDLLNKRKETQLKVATMTNDYSLNNANIGRSKSLGGELDRQINDRVDGIMAGLESQVNAKKAALSALTASVESAKKKDLEDASKNQPYYDAKRKLDEKLQAHELLYSKLQAEGSRLRKELNPEQADVAVPKPGPNAPVPQPEILTRENAFSTFSLNVSDVSFKLAAASLEKGQMPDAASIRSEEFINAFDYRDPEAAAGQALAFAAERARYPFAHNRDLLRFSIKTAAAGRSAGRALNLVLLLDNSGSMERADRVQIIREALRVLATQLQPQDTVSVVTFARTARLWADGVAGDKVAETLERVGGITPEGGTNLEEAMRLAYETARRHYLANGLNRVVLLTDGAANLGNVDAAVLKEKVEAQRKQGIALDCFGIGWEGFNDDLLEQLSSNGDGRYAFLNSPEDASKEFAAKLAGALQVAASDVKVQVEFNPQRVISWRQIGYAKHQLTKEQFRDNTVDAAEIAAQEAGNALYVVETKADGTGPVATVRVRYKVPGTTEYRERSWDVPYTGNAVSLEQSSAAMRLAATASAFSEWLAASPFAQEVSPDELLKTLSGVPQIFGADERPKKLEWMIRQAKSVAGK